MTDTPTTDALARLDGALARSDAAIEAVTSRMDRSRQDRETVALERDLAQAELEDLKTRHAALQAKADTAAERIEALIAVVERALAEPETAAEPALAPAPHAQEPSYAPAQPQPTYGYAPLAGTGR